MTLRRLPEGVINRIAAGEAIERPANVVKELVENALDAGARRIEATLARGGKSAVTVSDDGRGMSGDELALAIERHVTSKLDCDDLSAVSTLGFRGEALPSIGAVAPAADREPRPRRRRRVVARGRGRRRGKAPRPAALGAGTRVEVRDLFYATPARLKFLRSDRAETQAAAERFAETAMARPDVTFRLVCDGRTRYDLAAETGADARLARLRRVMATSSPTTLRPSPASAAAPSFPASPACRLSTAPRRASSICSSTDARCATACCSARCAAPIATCSRATAIRWRRSISNCRRARSM